MTAVSEPADRPHDTRMGAFRALGDATRLRALLLLRREALTVTELVQVLDAPQSSVSGVLRALGDAGLVASERDGRHAVYRAQTLPWLDAALAGVGLSSRDLAALETVREARLVEREVTGVSELDRVSVPGRSWRNLAEGLLMVSPLGVVADIGVGAGELTRLLARSAVRLYAVDSEAGRLASLVEHAEAEGLPIRPVRADFHAFELPERVDLVAINLSLAVAEEPRRVITCAVRALRPEGRIWITDLAPHDVVAVRERLGHRRLGFSPDELAALLSEAGLSQVRVTRVPGVAASRSGGPRRGSSFDAVVAVGVLAVPAGLRPAGATLAVPAGLGPAGATLAVPDDGPLSDYPHEEYSP